MLGKTLFKETSRSFFSTSYVPMQPHSAHKAGLLAGGLCCLQRRQPLHTAGLAPRDQLLVLQNPGSAAWGGVPRPAGPPGHQGVLPGTPPPSASPAPVQHGPFRCFNPLFVNQAASTVKSQYITEYKQLTPSPHLCQLPVSDKLCDIYDAWPLSCALSTGRLRRAGGGGSR